MHIMNVMVVLFRVCVLSGLRGKVGSNPVSVGLLSSFVLKYSFELF